MAAFLPDMAPQTLYVEEKKNRIADAIKSGSPMLGGFDSVINRTPLYYLSEVGHKAVCIDYSQLPVLSLSLTQTLEQVKEMQDASFQIAEPTATMLTISNEMFVGSETLSGDDYDLLCDMLDAQAMGEVHFSLV
jgi:hypothetical protein